MFITGTGAMVAAGSGAVTLTGTGGGSGTGEIGVSISGGAVISATGSGGVSITGTGGGSGTGEIGVSVTGGAVISATGSGTVTITGTGSAAGTGADFGVFLAGSSTIASTLDAGMPIVTGSGGTSGDAGVSIHGAAVNLGLAAAAPSGAQLTVVDDAGAAINGTFSNIPDFASVSLTFDGATYTFLATYAGGPDSQDLVLTQANDAYFDVTSTLDAIGAITGGYGTEADPFLASTLRVAVTAADTASIPAVIEFDPMVTASGPATIDLTIAGDGTAGPSAFGIYNNITIEGPTGTTSGVTLEGSGSMRLFYVAGTGASDHRLVDPQRRHRPGRQRQRACRRGRWDGRRHLQPGDA